MALAIIGVLLIIAAVVLYLVRRSQERKRRDIATTETLSTSDIAKLAASVGGELGDPKRFRQAVAVRGQISCDKPLTSEAAGEQCVYYQTTVTREYEESYTETDSQTGRMETKTRRETQTVSDNKRSVDFWVEDESGRIKVDPAGASVDSIQVADKFEPGDTGLLNGMLTVGGVTLSLGGGFGSGSRTIGYHVREKAVPVGRRVYVLGEASTAAGELMITQPTERGRRFIVSLKSDEELVRAADKAVLWLNISAVGSGVVGIVLLVLGLFSRR